MADFDWDWPKKIDRPLVERAFALDFIAEGRNLILLGPNGVGKTMIVKNLCLAAVQAGHSALFRTASQVLEDLRSDSPELVRGRLKKYARPAVLRIERGRISVLRLPRRRSAVRGRQPALRAEIDPRDVQQVMRCTA